MKSVLISIQPKWCELIASGKKTIEVRKTKPKLETPFKVYIYCTLKGDEVLIVSDKARKFNGKVIGEFVCDEIFEIEYQCGGYRCKGLTVLENDRVASASKLSFRDMRNYLSCNNGYGWHISNLVIYDKPRELREFYKRCYSGCDNCDNQCWKYSGGDKELVCIVENKKPISRPPQSWCYVESEVDTE